MFFHWYRTKLDFIGNELARGFTKLEAAQGNQMAVMNSLLTAIQQLINPATDNLPRLELPLSTDVAYERFVTQISSDQTFAQSAVC